VPAQRNHDWDWYDHVAVDRVMTGADPGRELTHAERVECARRALARGGSADSVDKLVGFGARHAYKLVAEVETGTCFIRLQQCAYIGCAVEFRTQDPRASFCSGPCRERSRERRTHATSRAASAA
jgi:hypothetical protein